MNSPHAARLFRFAFAMACALTAFRAAAETPIPGAPLELTAANIASVVDPLMGEWIDKRRGPGAVVIVVTRDAQVFAKGYGFSDIEAQKPFTPDATLVRAGSISKLFTGIAVMQLVEVGKLDLDRDVNDYVDFDISTPQGGVPVTLRRLLRHRAGFEEHVKGTFSGDREPEPLGPWLARNLPRRLFPEGDVEAYSNYGVTLAGYVVERASGEPFALYVQRHILDPLGMSHSTFRQPLPDDLAPLMAKGYRAADGPPLSFFVTTSMVPAGGLSTTGTDMGRFLRALMNGGELDGVRILPKARLDQMMAPGDATPAGYLGLSFFGTKIAGHDSIGHEGATMTFFSDLEFFPEQGIGVFVSRDGMGEITALNDFLTLPHPAKAIAERFLPKPQAAIDADAATLPGNSNAAGVYHRSRRTDSSWLSVSDLIAQSLVEVDASGNLRTFLAICPFCGGKTYKRVGRSLYEGPVGERVAFVDDAGREPYFSQPGIRAQRAPWFLDVRWVAPALAASVVIVFLTLIAWPIAVLWRHWRRKRWSMDRRDRRNYLAMRLVLLVDAAVVVATTLLFALGSQDPTILNDALDPFLLVLYGIAWLGVFGAIPTVWAATSFWRRRVGGRWSRIHNSLIAASSVMLSWFFLTFHIAGTTLTY